MTSPNNSDRSLRRLTGDESERSARFWEPYFRLVKCFRGLGILRDASDLHQCILSGSAVSCGTSTHPNCGINVSNQDWNSIVDGKGDMHLEVPAVEITIGVLDISSSFLHSLCREKGHNRQEFKPTGSKKLFFFLLSPCSTTLPRESLLWNWNTPLPLEATGD